MIIIGDVHGCYKTLMALIKKLPKDDTLCFVGDLIDRGKDSKEVLDFVLDGNHDMVLGNHEEMMLENMEMWIASGGAVTLNSMGDKFPEYVERLKLKPYYKIYDDIVDSNGRKLFLSHAGLCNRDIEHCIKTGMITWYRANNPRTLGIVDRKDLYQVFGHTPKEEPIILEHCANIDTGCYYNRYEPYGKLTALQFPQMKIFQQKNIEK